MHACVSSKPTLGCHKAELGLRFALEVCLDQLDPIFKVLKAVSVRDVEGKQHRLHQVPVTMAHSMDGAQLADLSAFQIGFDHLAANSLATNVPDLQRHVLVVGQLQSFHKEIQADGLIVAVPELVLAIAADQRGLQWKKESRPTNQCYRLLDSHSCTLPEVPSPTSTTYSHGGCQCDTIKTIVVSTLIVCAALSSSAMLQSMLPFANHPRPLVSKGRKGKTNRLLSRLTRKILGHDHDRNKQAASVKASCSLRLQAILGMLLAGRLGLGLLRNRVR